MMYSILCVAVLSLIAVHAEDVNTQIAYPIRECYNNSYLLTRDNRLPHNMITLIEIIRKIENSEDYSMTLRTLSTALLHGFRQDGIQRTENSLKLNGIIPYASSHWKFHRFVKLLRAIPGDALTFPNRSISDIEKCTLHFMLSSSIEEEKREGEEAICNKDLDNAYRLQRSINEEALINNSGGTREDVETLSPQQILEMSSNKQREEESEVDPNSFYSEFPPNHPAVAPYTKIEPSACPVENGVIKTKWGDVSAVPLIAGIAAAMEPQLININQLMRGESVEPGYFENSPKLNNKWLATITGDLAAVCWFQGPTKNENTPFQIGVDGRWNSTNLPRWYFLNSNTDIEMTRATLRGDVDGLIIASDVTSWNEDARRKMRLSQILDLYYSPRGLPGSPSRACYRKELFTKVAPLETLEQQTLSAVKALRSMAQVTISESVLQANSRKAALQVTSAIATSLKDDLSCSETDLHNDFTRPFVDLIIVLDTTWPFKNIQPMLAKILEDIEVGRYNSNFTLINGQNGDMMINTSNTILDFYYFNSSSYEKYRKGLDMPKSIETVRTMLEKKLDEEQRRRIGGNKAQVVLFIPFSTQLQDDSRNFCLDQIKSMREEIPDASFIFLTYGDKKRWEDLVQNPSDVFAIGISDSNSALRPIDSLITRLKQFPKRLINSQCGSKYESQGSAEAYIDSVEPLGVNIYRIHPNYFFGSDSTPRINIQGSNSNQLTICTSRELLYANKSQPTGSDSCKTINSDTHTIELSCGEASLIHDCQPYYISVKANSSSTPSYNCDDCRFPDEISYKMSYENLVCTSGVSSKTILPATFLLTITYFIRQFYV